MPKTKIIAFYLPQYHPIPENDEWWGKGFTEWANVASAKPLFKGHYQPRIPADLGYYDLRVPEVRQAQADLAKQYGIHGFCYWHYWFAGKQLLQRPFEEVLHSGKPDFPFCLAWANMPWTGIWNGNPGKVLMDQTYPGEQDHIAHFETLLPAFLDHRYIKVDGKPLFVIFKPNKLPFPAETIKLWQNLARESGLKGLHIVGMNSSINQRSRQKNLGFDASVINLFPWPERENHDFLIKQILRVFGNTRRKSIYKRLFKKPYEIYSFKNVDPGFVVIEDLDYEYYPCVVSNWDNTPRFGIDGKVAMDMSPNLFKQQLKKAMKRIQDEPDGHRIVFIKSWNEWAEGNYLEPDLKYGHAYLKAVKEAVKET